MTSYTNGGWRCAAWVVFKENFDYLKIDSSGKCPDGEVLTWEKGKCK